jgi:hypothetical protein
MRIKNKLKSSNISANVFMLGLDWARMSEIFNFDIVGWFPGRPAKITKTFFF